ncbi:MAG: winged helix DNA-binding protein [Planctomycetes bacterium]|nr:winged helix DNA-binding protein [Planctomycetota bacterium]
MPTQHRGTEKERRALNAYITLARAAETMAGRTLRPMARARLTTSQFGTLEALYHLGPLCQRDVAGKLLRSGGNLVVVADNLQKRGLVVRERNERDRRYVTLRLTEKGRRTVRQVFPRVLRTIVDEMAALTAAEQEAMRRLCRKLGCKGGRESNVMRGDECNKPRRLRRGGGHS